MRTPWVTSKAAIRERMLRPEQVALTEAEAEMPPYMENFLAHLRVLVGVPFEYLIADPRLLPDESIRFFYLDRSWTDRLADGAIAVGKIGTREQAHHQAHAPAVSQQLDLTERIVRSVQRGLDSFANLKAANDNNQQPADIVTGFVLRSAAVANWPHMDVRAYSEDIPEPLDPAVDANLARQLVLLRLERLSPSVMIALFQGIPQLVYLEEPHHAMQFGVNTNLRGGLEIDLRKKDGEQVRVDPNNPKSNPIPIQVPVRAGHHNVVHVSALRRALFQAQPAHPETPNQNGSAAFAVEVLQPPWRQRFEGTVDMAEQTGGSGRFTGFLAIGTRVQDQGTINAVKLLIQKG